ncbi:MAG: hypothetical protein CMF48_07090 [Legionellales bacterium]|nr:hypothetical protein [Legionellales bacterium]|tara:strand:- start:436 stop:1935 length:1500 start_codon:yes stop_codon:yes gene_type:complete
MLKTPSGLMIRLLFTWIILVGTAFAVERTEEQLLLDQKIHFIETMLKGFQAVSDPTEIWSGFNPIESPLIVAMDDGDWFGINIEALEGWKKINAEGLSFPIYMTQINVAGKQDKVRDVRVLRLSDGTIVPILHLSDESFNDRERLNALANLISQRFKFYARVESENLQQFWIMGGDNIVDLFSTRLLRAKRMASMALARDQLTNYVHTLDINHLLNYLALYKDMTHILSEEEMLRMQIGNIDGVGEYVASKAALRFFPGLILKDLIVRSLTTYNVTDNIVNWLNYGRQLSIGQTLAFALDTTKIPDWQKLVGKMPLEDILISSLNVSNEELIDRANSFMSGSLFDAMVARADDEIADYDQKVDSMIREYEKYDDGLLLELVGPVMLFGQNISSFELDLKKLTLIPDFDGTIRLPGEPVRFLIDHLPVAIINAKEHHIPLSEMQLEITVDGQSGLTVNKDSKWYRRFKSLSFETNKVIASVERPGFISADKGKIFIQVSQ